MGSSCGWGLSLGKQKALVMSEGFIKENGFDRLVRSGGALLSRVLRHSTIGAEAFNGRVRNGIGFWALRHSHQIKQTCLLFFS